MRRVLRNAGWLLVPEPSKEGAIRGGAWIFLLIGIAWGVFGFAYLSLLGSPLRSFLDVSSDALTAWVTGIVFVALAALHALPAARRRAVLGARVVCTLSLLALAPSFLLRFLDLGPNGVQGEIALLWIVLILSFNYVVNRRRARHSSRGVAA